MGNGFGKYIRYIIDGILEVIYGNDGKCVICEGYSHGEDMCYECRKKLCVDYISGTIHRDELDIQLFSCCYYDIIIKNLIIKLKYKSDFRAGGVLVGLLKKAADRLGLDQDVFTFVPSSSEAYKKRGYNQSEFLCRKLADMQNRKAVECLCVTKSKADQIGLDGSERWKNLDGVFSVDSRKGIINKNVLLIDDVITTGATVFYCAKAIMDAGAKSVTVLTVAKSTI